MFFTGEGGGWIHHFWAFLANYARMQRQSFGDGQMSACCGHCRRPNVFRTPFPINSDSDRAVFNITSGRGWQLRLLQVKKEQGKQNYSLWQFECDGMCGHDEACTFVVEQKIRTMFVVKGPCRQNAGSVRSKGLPRQNNNLFNLDCKLKTINLDGMQSRCKRMAVIWQGLAWVTGSHWPKVLTINVLVRLWWCLWFHLFTTFEW